MSRQPVNLASELAQSWNVVFGVRRWNDELGALFADQAAEDFVSERRRHLDRTSHGVRGSIANLETILDVNGGPMVITREELIGTRGDRLAARRVRFELTEDAIFDTILVDLFDTDLRRLRSFTLEADAVPEAIELLDELHAAHPEPVVAGAYESALARLDAFRGAVERVDPAEGS